MHLYSTKNLYNFLDSSDKIWPTIGYLGDGLNKEYYRSHYFELKCC